MKSFVFKYFSTAVLFLFAFVNPATAETVDYERTKSIHTLTAEKEELHLQLAETWAPVFHHEYNGEKSGKGKQTKEKMSLTDAMIGPSFDGDSDYSNNKSNLFAARTDSNDPLVPKLTLRSEVGYSIVESKSHFYLSYMPYHAIDGKRKEEINGQDSEKVWIVLKKNSDALLPPELEFFITNVYGFPMLYANDAGEQKKFRENLRSLMKTLDWIKTMTYPLNDGSWGILGKWFILGGWGILEKPSAFRPDPAGNQRLHMVITKGSHSIYSWPGDWEWDPRKGYTYFCVQKGGNNEIPCNPMNPVDNRSIGYTLYSLDELFLSNYPHNENELKDPEKAALEEKRSKMFVQKTPNNNFNNWKTTTDLGDIIRLRDNPRIPDHIVAATGQKTPEADLPMDWRLKSKDYKRLGMPHLLHREINKDNPNISNEYIYNPYIEFIAQ